MGECSLQRARSSRSAAQAAAQTTVGFFTRVSPWSTELRRISRLRSPLHCRYGVLIDKLRTGRREWRQKFLYWNDWQFRQWCTFQEAQNCWSLALMLLAYKAQTCSEEHGDSHTNFLPRCKVVLPRLCSLPYNPSSARDCLQHSCSFPAGKIPATSH